MKAATCVLAVGASLLVNGSTEAQLLASATHETRAGLVVSGRVSELVGGTPLPGATIHLAELGRMAISDRDGRFALQDVPPGTFTLGADKDGFGSVHLRIEVPLAGPLEIQLPPRTFQDEVTVTATPFTIDPLDASQQVDIVSGDTARREGAASLGQLLESVPGISTIPTGEALGTPVVRGLSENRIKVLSDGLGLNHQQFSWRHSPNVEPSLAERIEVVRGPASILYGSDAMGGVINLVQRPLLVTEARQAVVHGEVATGWGSNAREHSGHAELQGALGAVGFNLGLVHRSSDDIRTPDATLGNTDFDQTNGNLAAGVGGAWGTARVRWNHWELATGFFRPVGFRLGLEDDLVAGDAYLPTRIGDIEILAGRQTNLRKAFPQGTSRPPAVDLELVTDTARVGLHHRTFGPFRGRVAIEQVTVESSTRLTTDLLPEHQSRAWAVMLYEEARFAPSKTGGDHRLIVSAGARWDTSRLDVDRDLSRNLPDGFRADYHAITGSAGLVWRMTRSASLAANLGRGWRPPNAFELLAKGVHGGVSAVQNGNRDLVEESNLNAELSLRFRAERGQGYVTAFRNRFDGFIYLADTGEKQGTLPVFTYRQGDARVEGLEALIEVAAFPWLRLGATYAVVATESRETRRPLPQEPARRATAWSRFDLGALGPLRSLHADIELVAVGSQDVSGPDEPFGVPTDAYELVNLKAGLELPTGRMTWGLDLSVRNLLDESYTDFLYSYKAVAQNPGRDVRLLGRLRF